MTTESSIKPQISVVVPVFNEAESIAYLHAALRAALSGSSHEVVIVDDGSTDASSREIAKFPEFRCVSIPRSGKSRALAAGIDAATADTIVTIDADLQEDPAQIPALLAALRRGADLAYGCRTPRVDGLLKKRVPSLIYRLALLLLFQRDFRDINCGFRAARREVRRTVTWFNGAHRLVPLLVARKGGKIAAVPVRHRPRVYGRAKYDSPLRGLEGLRDLLKVRLGMIDRAHLTARERSVG